MRVCFVRFAAVLCLAVTAGIARAQPSWPTYGGDPGGQRFTAAKQITTANVARLQQAWTFHTGALVKNRPGTASSSFEATPIMFHGMLLVSSPFDEVFALDPGTGRALWSFDPQLPDVTGAGVLTSRGVAAWPLAKDDAPLPASAQACVARIFLATMDARLHALDATTGKPCSDFGSGGFVDLKRDVGYKEDDPYFITSPPTVVGDVVVVGSGIGDNLRVDINSGQVRGFDVRSGRQVWKWEPLPWAQQVGQNGKRISGAGNAWSVIAADPEHNLVFVPTGAPSPDFYGGLRPGDNRDANSVVALEATTGRRVWGFQVVHHDLWDYDAASEPLLFTFRVSTPAIAITTKQGLVFLLNRLTGEPLFPVVERAVPRSDIYGEVASPTQPFQQVDGETALALSPLTLPPDAKLGVTDEDDRDCRSKIAALRYEGIYTPPSLRGTLAFPGSLGGVNWGGASLGPATNTLYANTNRYAFALTLVPRRPWWRKMWDEFWDDSQEMVAFFTALAVALVLMGFMLFRRSWKPGWIAAGIAVSFAVGGCIAYWQFAPPPVPPGMVHHRPPPPADPLLAEASKASRSAEHFGHEYSPQYGSPYSIRRTPLLAKSGHPCTTMPFGAVSALDLNTGKASWQSALGTVVAGQHSGAISLGGTLVTGSGLLFTAGSSEPLLRAFHAGSGKELWSTGLPVPAQATPMSYMWQSKQYVVIAAGGHGGFGTPLGDSVVAYALPSP